MYLDMDAMIVENNSLPENPVEMLLTASNDTHPDAFLFLPTMGIGWNTDFVFVMNNARSKAFMDYMNKSKLNKEAMTELLRETWEDSDSEVEFSDDE